MRSRTGQCAAALVGAALAIACGGDSQGPEGTGGRVIVRPALNEIVQGSVAEGESKWYLVVVPSRAPFSALLKADSGTLVVRLRDTLFTRIHDMLTVTPGTLPLGREGTQPRQEWQETGYVIEVTGGGRYTLQPYVPDSLPELISDIIAPGDTIDGETIVAESDHDRFRFLGILGQEYLASVQMLEPSIRTLLRLTVEGASLPETHDLAASLPGESLWHRRVRFVTPSNASYRINVFSEYATNSGYMGPYRFALRMLDRGPEEFDGVVVVGDTVSGEALDYPGDIDQFTLTGTPETPLRVYFQVDATDPATRMTLQAGGTEAISAGDDSPRWQKNVAFTLDGNGIAMLRIMSVGPGPIVGRYRFIVVPR